MILFFIVSVENIFKKVEKSCQKPLTNIYCYGIIAKLSLREDGFGDHVLI